MLKGVSLLLRLVYLVNWIYLHLGLFVYSLDFVFFHEYLICSTLKGTVFPGLSNVHCTVAAGSSWYLYLSNIYSTVKDASRLSFIPKIGAFL